MNIYYLGDPPVAFTNSRWPAAPIRLSQEPLFDVDALFIFASDMTFEERSMVQLVERSGRPAVRIGAVDIPVQRKGGSNVLMIRDFGAGDELVFLDWIAHQPRTNYRPVDCGFYDFVESVIVGAKSARLVYVHADGKPFSVELVLKATKTDQGEEYVQFEDGCWIRMDRILRLDGKSPPSRKRG